MPEKRAGTPSWWQTVPGILTGIAAIITAVTGFILAYSAFNNTKKISEEPKSEVVKPSTTLQPDLPKAPSVLSNAGGARSDASSSVPLPAIHHVKLVSAEALVTIQSAKLEPIDADRNSLTFTVQYRNLGTYPKNFWSRSFRLIVNGVPQAPTNEPNEVVQGESAKDAEFDFELSNKVKNVELQISYNEEKRLISFQLP